ncbi:MAG: hypothetical protein ABW022_26865 [Actinoplanes sp.]
MVKRHGRRIWALMVAALLLIVGVVAGFWFAPAADAEELPQSLTLDGVVHQRAHLVNFNTYRGEKMTSVLLPVTSRPIVVRASCRLAILHTSSAMSALRTENWWMRTGGDAADLPDTAGNEYLTCAPGRGNDRLTQIIDPSWLPGQGDQRLLTWHEMPTSGDTPSDAPASWALAVYTAG